MIHHVSICVHTCQLSAEIRKWETVKMSTTVAARETSSGEKGATTVVETKAVAAAVSPIGTGDQLGGKIVGGVEKSMMGTEGGATRVLEGIVVEGGIGAHLHRRDQGGQNGKCNSN